MQQEYKFKIDGKVGVTARLIITLVIALIFISLAVAQLVTNDFRITFMLFSFSVPAIIMLVTFLKLLNRYLFFNVCIYDNGFSIQTNPFDKEFYEYALITNCYVDTRTRNNNGAMLEQYFFVFKSRAGKPTEFQFEPALHEDAINALQSNILNAINK